MSPEHQSLNVSCLCVACVSVWSWAALQFALPDLKIAVHLLFALYCMVYYKSVFVCGPCVVVHFCGFGVCLSVSKGWPLMVL